MSVVLLDNEAVQAMVDPRHSKHRRVIAHLESAVARRSRGDLTTVLVPCAVRVEAGWNRAGRTHSAIKRFRVADVTLDSRHSNAAADILVRERVSVADAHVGAVVTSSRWSAPVILTSDPDDMRRVCAPTRVNAVRV